MSYLFAIHGRSTLDDNGVDPNDFIENLTLNLKSYDEEVIVKYSNEKTFIGIVFPSRCQFPVASITAEVLKASRKSSLNEVRIDSMTEKEYEDFFKLFPGDTQN